MRLLVVEGDVGRDVVRLLVVEGEVSAGKSFIRMCTGGIFVYSTVWKMALCAFLLVFYYSSAIIRLGNNAYLQKYKEEYGMNITFKSVTDENELKNWNGGSLIRHVGNILKNPMSMPLTYGRLLKLFGEPAYSSGNLEDMYNYFILGTDDEGNTYQLMVYCGATGPAIGGASDDPRLEEAAAKLEEYINASDYVDFDYEGVYEDFDAEVKFGIRNGEPYMEDSDMDEMGDMGELADLDELGKLGIDLDDFM